MEEIVELRRQLEEERHRREAAETQRKEEQRRREVAEEAARDALPNTINGYLQDCHELWRAVRAVTDLSLTTQGDTTRPAGRKYPKRIIPWEDNFITRQRRVWERLSDSLSFGSSRVFPSSHQMQYVRSTLDPISSESGLRYVGRDIVENAVQKLVKEVSQDADLQVRLNLQGTISFESHTNLGSSRDETIEKAMSHVSLQPSGITGKGRGTRAAGQGRGQGGRADQFCIYRLTNEKRSPVVAIEYKAPHKLTQEIIVTGLTGEIVPDCDVINHDDDSAEYLAKWLMAAVVTQCFSYMIHHGLHDGYIFTGEVIIFLHIPDDPTIVYYHTCIPSLDVSQEDDDRLHRTAVAQIFAFILHAMATDLPPQTWHDAAAKLDTWAIEYVDILKKIPETARKPGVSPSPSAYKPRRWKEVERSPILTRARCVAGNADSNNQYRGDRNDDRGDLDPPSPTPPPQPNATRSSQRQVSKRTNKGSGTQSNSDDVGYRASIHEQPFCTHNCLLGLIRGENLDPTCPNIGSHQEKHIPREDFLHLIRAQLATDRGSNADCMPLHVKGSRGALFKIRLSSHGYTFVAKGMEEHNQKHLRNESRVYKHLSDLQGTYIPACMGELLLQLPYYYSGGEYTRMLLLSWAGRPLCEYVRSDNWPLFMQKATEAVRAFHQRHVLHGDAELRNLVYDKVEGRLMVVDLERATIRKPLGNISSNRKRKRGFQKNNAGDSYLREVCSLRGCMSRSVR